MDEVAKYSNSVHVASEKVIKHKYIHEISENTLIPVYPLLDKNNLWIAAARKMGYETHHILIFLHKSKSSSPSDSLISDWSDYNHTVTELFMVLYSLQQYYAMSFLKEHVDKEYHRLILNYQPVLEVLFDEQFERNSHFTAASESPEPNVSDSMNIDFLSHIKCIPFLELKQATQNWNPSLILGKGGFGVVYKGRWKNTDVAIKEIKYANNQNQKTEAIKKEIKQSINEFKFMNLCRHDNILPLYGCSIDKQPLVVFQFMAEGSLASHLKSKTRKARLSSFDELKNIAIGVARGLQFLHTYSDKPLIHADIKPANILLDEKMVAKIGDFGLVREGAENPEEVSCAFGTRPYLPEEFLFKRIFSTKIDTYSFGIVLFEMMTGLPASIKKSPVNIVYLVQHMRSNCDVKNTEKIAELLDDRFQTDSYMRTIGTRIISLSLICTNMNFKKRPEMVEVLKAMDNGILKV